MTAVLFVFHSGSLMWYLSVINLLEKQCTMNVLCPPCLIMEREETYSISLSSEALAYILPIIVKCVCSESLHRDAGPILGHSCIAVKMLALQGGIYNVCGMYNV